MEALQTLDQEDLRGPIEAMLLVSTEPVSAAALAVALKVPLDVDAKMGETWYDCK